MSVTELDIEDLYQWIDSYPITRQKRNINRDFSDAIPLAEILKQHFPKLVELHNYTPRNSFAQKLVNWHTLNRKVLSKMKMSLSKEIIEQLANSAPGVIEQVLFDLKVKLETKDTDENCSDVYFVQGLSAEATGSTVLPIKLKSGSKVTDQKMVPSNIYNKMVVDIVEKDEIISNLKNKVQHLESLLAIKEERMNDLSQQLQKMSNNNLPMSRSSTISSSNFFNKIF